MAKTIDRRLWKRLGVEVMLGDLHNIDTIREAMEALMRHIWSTLVQAGLVDGTVNFAQAAREAGVSAILTRAP